jgi:hypothetical protein
LPNAFHHLRQYVIAHRLTSPPGQLRTEAARGSLTAPAPASRVIKLQRM